MEKPTTAETAIKSIFSSRGISVLLPSADISEPISASLSPQKPLGDQYQPLLFDPDTSYLSPPVQSYNKTLFCDISVDDDIELPSDVISELDKTIQQTTQYLDFNRCSHQVGGYFLKRRLSSNLSETLYLAQHLATGYNVAIKTASKKDAVSFGRLKNEIECMDIIAHPNIITVLDVVEDEENISIVMPYGAAGDLYHYLLTCGPLPLSIVKRIFNQLISAVHHCHSLGIIHQDIKLENIILDRNHDIYLIDFGLAIKMDVNERVITSCGSAEYAAPEILISKAHCGPSVDIWSMGVILFTLLTGELPFTDKKTSRLYSKISSVQYTWPSGVDVDSQGKDLVTKMLKAFPEERISLKNIIDHEFLRSEVMSIFSRIPPESESAVKKSAAIHDCPESYVREIMESRKRSSIFATCYLLRDAEEDIQMEPQFSRPRLQREIDPIRISTAMKTQEI